MLQFFVFGHPFTSEVQWAGIDVGKNPHGEVSILALPCLRIKRDARKDIFRRLFHFSPPQILDKTFFIPYIHHRTDERI